MVMKFGESYFHNTVLTAYTLEIMFSECIYGYVIFKCFVVSDI